MTFEKERPIRRSDRDDFRNEETLAGILKPIAVHEAKSAFYKAKLACYIAQKGMTGIKNAGFKIRRSFDNSSKKMR